MSVYSLNTFKNDVGTFFKKKKMLIIVVGFLLFISLYILNPRLDRDVLFWFLSSVSQSMAAMFAVVGMFAIFRFESLNDSVKRQLDNIRGYLLTEEANSLLRLIGHVGLVEEGALNNIQDELEGEVGKDLETRSPLIHNNLYVSVLVCKQNINVRNNVKKFASIPMITMLTNFVLSSLSLLFINSLFGKSGSFENTASVIISAIVILIIVSVISIMRFFMISFSRG